MALSDEPPHRGTIIEIYSRRKKLVTRTVTRWTSDDQGQQPTLLPAQVPQQTFPSPLHIQPYQVGPSIAPEYRADQAGPSQAGLSEDRRQNIKPAGDTFNPSEQPTQKIRDIFMSRYDTPYPTWIHIPENVRDIWFKDFEREFKWLPQHNARIRTLFEMRGCTCLTDMLFSIYNTRKRPLWLREDIFVELMQTWSSEFVTAIEQNKKNSASNCGGLGASLQSVGYVPHTEHRRRLKAVLSREPTQLELHIKTHQYKADQQWVEHRSYLSSSASYCVNGDEHEISRQRLDAMSKEHEEMRKMLTTIISRQTLIHQELQAIRQSQRRRRGSRRCQR